MDQLAVKQRPDDRKRIKWDAITSGLQLPAIAAPMFLVSGPDLVVACCRAGVIGSFPTVNARSPEILDQWLASIKADLHGERGAAPPAVNLVVHRSNPRVADDLAVVARHRIPLVIASVGDPRPVIDRVHDYGGLVFSDVASEKHARRAVQAGVDGLILLCAGAGGNTGWLSPFSFVPAVRRFFSGPLAVAGGIADGRAIRAAEILGADLSYLGTRFIAARESLASDEYRQMLFESGLDDIQLTNAVTGIPANFLRLSLERTGFNLKGGQRGGDFDVIRELDALKAWKHIWSAGHSVFGVDKVQTAAEIVAELRAEYLQAMRVR